MGGRKAQPIGGAGNRTMKKTGQDQIDPRFHFEIWSGRSEAMNARSPSFYYCENHNGDLDYCLAQTNFRMAADALIAIHRQDPHLGNWVAPILHLIRQTLELSLKSLLETIDWKLKATERPFRFSHDLQKLWDQGRGWFVQNGYQIELDARLSDTDRLIENMHAIDPSGDLFRFGTSMQTAFGRQKSSDRVGFVADDLFREFEGACGCLGHWGGVVMREIIQQEQGWTEDPHFDRDDFPRIPTSR
jgi:hypothetical protein